MQSISEIIHAIARQRGRGEQEPLLATLPIEGASGERIAHLPIEVDLAQSWVALTGEPFRPHQAHALTALRRGEPLALRAASADVTMTASLLLYAMLLTNRSATALLLAPDEDALQAARVQIARINAQLPQPLRLAATTIEPNRRADLYARLVIATPEHIHSRLLRHHDRAWRLFWPRLLLAVLPDIQRYTGVAAAQLADLLMRIQRIAASHSGSLPNLLATLEDVADCEPTLSGLIGQPWRVVPADDGARQPTTLAVWQSADATRGGPARLRDSVEIATEIQRQGYQVHICCRPYEQALVAPLLEQTAGLTLGPDLAPGHALVVAGYPGAHSRLRRMLRAGYQTVVLVLGDLPHEQALARRAESLLTDPAPTWVAPPPNAYVLAKNILCAASEQPLTAAEVAAWGVGDIVDRLAAQGRLVALPDAELAWKPTDAAGDPYAQWDVRSAVGAAAVARTEQGQVVGEIEASIYERWAFPQAALPAGTSGLRILTRDEDTSALTVRLDSVARRTFPLRRCQITVRENRATRTLPGSRTLGWGRVVVEEEIYGYRAMTAGGTPAEMALTPTLSARWAAPACWFDLPAAVQVLGQFIGWSLAAALTLRALAAFTDVVPCYDHEARRLYLVDAQPGGNGLAIWAYGHTEELLPLAYDIAHACRTDPLLEPLSRVDMDWLLALLGPQRAPERTRAPAPAPAAAPRRLEFIEGPPPGQRPRFDAPALPVSEPARERRLPPAEQGSLAEDVATPARPAPADLPARLKASRTARRTQHARAAGAAAARPPRRNAAASKPAPDPQAPAGGATPAPAPSGDREPPADRPALAPAPAPPQPDQPLPPSQEATPADPTALLARLRHEREQRESQAIGGQSDRNRAWAASMGAEPSPEVEQRFAAGDRICCRPYGDGVVRESRVADGRELLLVAFPDYGELEIDPAVSLARKRAHTPPADDDAT